MANKGVKLLAQEWRVHHDVDTGELIMEPGFTSSRNKCAVVATPIPGTDPVQFEYSCLSITCTGDNECVLKKSTLPDGTVVYFCECEPSGGVSAAVGRRTRKKAS